MTRRRQRIVLATNNRGKLAEIRALVGELEVEWLTMSEVLPQMAAIEEDGARFEDNAIKKAREVARASGLVSLADDSGLEVDELAGEPGVYSARYSGPGATDARNIELLLTKLAGVPAARRTARFRCVMCLCKPEAGGEQIETTAGRCEGRIAMARRGSGGFGYDPVFEVDGLGCTMAELTSEQKNRISHRAMALRAMRPVIEKLLRVQR